MAFRIGSMFVNLALEDAAFQTGLKRAASEAETAMARMKTAASAVSVAFAAVTANAIVQTLRTQTGAALDYADAIVDLSDRTGASIQTVQAFGYSAQMAGSSVEEARAGLDRFAKTLGQAQRGGKSQAEMFDAMGISIRNAEGKYRTFDDVFTQFADKVKAMPTEQARVAAATDFMGKSAASLAVALGEGSAGLSAMRMEAARLGITLDQDILRKAGPVNDQLVRMKMIADAAMAQAIVQNADALLQLAGGLTQVGMAAINALGKLGEFYGEIRKQRELNEISSDIGAGHSYLGGLIKTKGVGKPTKTLWQSLLDHVGGANDNITGTYRDPQLGTLDLGAVENAAKKAKAKAAQVEGLTTAQMRDMISTPRLRSDILTGAYGSEFETNLRLMRDRTEEVKDVVTDKLGPAFEQLTDQINAPFQQAVEFGKQLSSNLAQSVVYGQNLGDALVNSLKAAAAEALASGLFKLLGDGSAGNDGLIGGTIASIFAGFRADGGPVSAGRAYMVGERGPEMIIPAHAGTVISNAMLRGGGGGTTIHVDARGSDDPAAVERAVAQGVAVAIAHTNASFAARERMRLVRSRGA